MKNVGGPTMIRTRLGLSLIYFHYFFFNGVNLPYFSVWLHDRALTTERIAVLSTLSFAAKTLGQLTIPYVFTRFDSGDVVARCAALSLLATAALIPWHFNLLIYLSVAIGGIFIGAMIPLADSLTIGHGGLSFGRIRLWGSVGYALANLVGGFAVDWLSASTVVVLESLALLGLLGSSLLLEAGGRRDGPVVDVTVPRPRSRDILEVVLTRPFWLLTLSVAAISGSHAFMYTFGTLYWAQELHLGKSVIGCLWAAAVTAEIVLMVSIGSGSTVRRAILLTLAGGLGATLRWTVTAIAPPLPVLFGCQLLHGLSFGATLVGGYQLLRRLTPLHILPAVVGIYSALVNGVVIGLITAMLTTSEQMAGPAGLGYMAVVALVGTIGVVLFAVTYRESARIACHHIRS